jgi:hypothetical protein
MNKINKIEVTTADEETVDIQSLDSFQLKNVDFIKVDVEGFEADVLEGAEETIKRCKPLILVEAFEDTRVKVENLMTNFGYKKFITFKEFDTLYIPA